MAICITVAIGKGGVGKTATTVNLAAAMALDGKKVLVVDTDIQANSTYFLTGESLMDNPFPKNGLFDNRVTSFMNYVSTLSNYDELQVASGLAKVITDVYTENWNDKSLGEYIAELKALKAEVETIKDQVETGKRKLSFEGLNGNLIERYYEPTDNADVNILRNILEDTLDEYSDLSANDRVAVLLEMIESIIE